MSELRRDPVSGTWVVVSLDQEAGVNLHPDKRFQTPPEECPFCPGNEAESGHTIVAFPPVENGDPQTPPIAIWGLRVIPNRLPVLRTEMTLEREGIGMFDRISGVGAHEIIIDSPHHDHALHEFPLPQTRLMFSAWRDRLNDLRRDSRLRYISIFRNQGRRAGARISHPHSQLIATPAIPPNIRNELAGAKEYFEYKERCVFCDLIDQEREEKIRLVTQNRGFLAFCPFASRNPFEIWIVPRVHAHDYGTIREDQLLDLSEIITQVVTTVALALADPDVNLVLKSTPYPLRRGAKWMTLEEDYHWHLEVIPRIARPTGYEWTTGMFVNPTPPEEAAAYLREFL
jgi:UDPglucose--hexose-1-phosphate uridylyltransferase